MAKSHESNVPHYQISYMKQPPKTASIMLADWINSRSDQTSLLNIKTGLICLGAFTAAFIVVIILHFALAAQDRQTEIWIFSNTTKASYSVFNRITHFGESILLVPVTFILVAWWVIWKKWEKAAFFGLSVLGGGFLTLILKLLFQSERSNLITGVINEFDLGFPSGHTIMSLLFWGSIAYLIVQGIHSSKIQWGVMGGAGLMTFVVGLTRLFLGVHYPGDVLGGWASGAMWLTFSILVVDYVVWKQHLKQPLQSHNMD